MDSEFAPGPADDVEVEDAADVEAPGSHFDQKPVDAPDGDQDVDPQPVEVKAPPRLSPPEPSGLPSVDSAVERLAALDQLPVEDHIEVFDDVQRRLHDSLAELDDEQ